jgi:hypothetical protein
MDFNKTLSLLEGKEQDAVFGDKSFKVFGVYDKNNDLVKKFMLDRDAREYAKEHGYRMNATTATQNEMKTKWIKK